MIDHEQIKTLISAYIDGELNQEEQKILEEHLKTCDSCQKDLQVLKNISSVLKQWPEESLSPDLEQKLHTTLRKESKEGIKMKKNQWITVGGGGVLIAVLVLMVSFQVFKQVAPRGMEGKLKSPNNIGDQFSPGNTNMVQPLSQSSARAGQYFFKEEVGDLWKTIQYEPYYLEVPIGQEPQGIRATSGHAWMGTITENSYRTGGPFHTEGYDRIYENQFLEVAQNPLSTFSIDVDTASYSNIRRFLNGNTLPPEDAVRIEEMVNYFSYDYPKPKGDEPFSITIKGAKCPWNEDHQLALIGLQGKTLDVKEIPPSNLVFLIDVSGSMQDHNKLSLLKSAFKLMVNQLSEKEKVAIVVYAGAAGLVLEATSGSNKQKILDAIDSLSAGGSTAGGQGIRLAYETAQENFIKGGNNRVILATDGDFNVGISSDGELTRLIEEKRKEGIFLTILGFGMGNYKDSKMEKLADKGNGNYYYLDTFNEAQKVLVQELGSTLFAIAKDVKIQIEFNPSAVKAYRLIGYENRILAKEDFHDDTKDAGELGAGHSVTALYEIVPADSKEEFSNVDELKYQQTKAVSSSDLMTVKLRYKDPDADKSKFIAQSIKKEEVTVAPEGDFAFAAAVAEFGLLLRNSEFKKNASYEHVLKIVRDSLGEDSFGYRSELMDLVKKAKMLDTRSQGINGIQFKN